MHFELRELDRDGPSSFIEDGDGGYASRPLVVLTDNPAAQASASRAVLAKDASADLVEAATRLAAAGYTVRRAKADDDRQPADPEGASALLSAREMQVLSLLADGASNKVIARKLAISVHTAKFHVGSVTTKLGARNRTDAIATALRRGLPLG